ncbi:MAG: hypothetical protein NUV56_00965 [Candidatus Uhrbacteria bacterium]|nr:hypothetical protein [Candidatus Uhrbacteria bacterium]
MKSIPKNVRMTLIAFGAFLVLIFLLMWIRYGAMFSDDGIFDKAYHRQEIINVDSPTGYGSSWSRDEPYICRIMKDASNYKNPFTHCSLGSYMGQWILFPSIMNSQKTNE